MTELRVVVNGAGGTFKAAGAVAISDEPAEQLKPFVQFKGAEIEFAVAVDDDARKAMGTYQQAFNQMMLPRAYVVGKNGNVLWYGHPLRGLDEVVEAVSRACGGNRSPWLALRRRDHAGRWAAV